MADRELVSEIFLRAAALAPEEREKLLDRMCGDDPEIRKQVETLLRDEQRAPEILRTGSLLERAQQEMDRVPERIGPYHLLERLGEGGMGVVHRAEQVEPLQRQVAIKLLKRGLETKQVLQRFDMERQVLALLDHPGIARVLDAGATEAGRPYFVMELVTGQPIHDFCRHRSLDLEQRIELFLRVCDAVHHAHQNAIIHRDIKPSNILVTQIDAQPAPKIIDFGIAKALAPVVGGAHMTEIGQAMGTLEYMSPEQASGTPLGIDTRADVYSLGAVLYELLAGAPPYDPQRLRENGPAAACRLIATEEPPRASAQAASPAARKSLTGDLDAITMKALEKDRDHRYDSVLSLAADLRRYQRHEPVEARSWSTLYRFQKLLRKHRLGMAVAGTLVLLLVTFSAVLAFQARRVAEQRDRAEEVSDFLIQFYEAPPYVRGRHERGVGPLDVLRGSAARIDESLAGLPMLSARLAHAMGRMFGDIDEPGDAEPLLTSALERFESIGAMEPAMRASYDLAVVHNALGRTGAANAMVTALEGMKRSLGENHPDTLWSMVEVGNQQHRALQSAEAVELLEEAAAGLRRALGPDHTKSLIASGVLAGVYVDLGRLADAEDVLTGLVRRLEEGTPERGHALFNLATVHAARGERDSALALLRQALASDFRIGIRSIRDWERLLDDPEFIELATWIEGHADQGSLGQMERSHRDKGDLARAEEYLRTFLETIPLSEEHADRLRYSQVVVLVGLGRLDDALPLLQRTVEFTERNTGADHGLTLIRRQLLAQVQLGLGDQQGALATLARMRAAWQHPHRVSWWDFYARACQAAIQGDDDRALEHLYQSARRGLTRIDWLENDPALARIRDSPRFQEVVQEVRRRTWVP